MNTLMYELSEFCKDMTIKNFRDYAWLWEWAIWRSSSYKTLNKKENLKLFDERLEFKIRELIRFKKRLEKIINAKDTLER